MKIRGNERGIQDTDTLVAHMRIEGIAYRVRGRRFFDIDMGDLTERVHPGIGSPCAIDAHGFAAEIVNRTVDSLNLSLVVNGDVYKSKNIMRLLGNLV